MKTFLKVLAGFIAVFAGMNGMYGLTLLIKTIGFMPWLGTLYPPLSFLIGAVSLFGSVTLLVVACILIFYYLRVAFRVPLA